MARLLILLVALLFALPALADPIDLNSATAEQLDTLPGIGPAKAEAIIRFREENGPFPNVEALIEVSGIGPATLENVRSLVAVGGGASATAAPDATPAADETPAAEAPSEPGAVNINTASAAELENLPGIGATKASAIVGDREANGPFASCEDLTRVTGIGPATLASIRDLCVVK